jgi:hypothetical protein
MPVFDDVTIREMYQEYNIPCDSIVSDQKQLLIFADDYIHRTGHKVGLTHFAHHLLTLRKRGEAKGRLPRLRRIYNVRN